MKEKKLSPQLSNIMNEYLKNGILWKAKKIGTRYIFLGPRDRAWSVMKTLT